MVPSLTQWISDGTMKGREVLVGVSGGIAAYKTAAMVSQMVQLGVRVQVAMTPAAEQFVGTATFAALTGAPSPRRCSTIVSSRWERTSCWPSNAS